MKKIIVIGAGAWGTALADLLARNSNQVFLSANNREIIDEINRKNTNQKFLPKVKLDQKIKAIASFEDEMKSADLVFIVTPSSSSAAVFQKITQVKIKKNCQFVICSKGFEANSLDLLSDAFEKITAIKNYAVLSGPNFALEVANQVPSITTIAAKNKKLAGEVIAVLSNETFQAQYFADPRTAEICGIVKNIIAIGCGIIDALNLGANAKAALVLKGINEIQIICRKLKASTDIASAAGFGDIFLTCSSQKSRNNWLGSQLAQGKTYAEILKESNKTFEGATSAQVLAKVAKKLKLQLDLCANINDILSCKHNATQIKILISKSILS